MGFVKSALAATRFSCGDDADFFFTMLFLACVNYQQERDANGTIRVRAHVGIFKNPCRGRAGLTNEGLVVKLCGTATVQ